MIRVERRRQLRVSSIPLWGLIGAVLFLVLAISEAKAAVPFEIPCPVTAQCTVYSQSIVSVPTGVKFTVTWAGPLNAGTDVEVQLVAFPPTGNPPPTNTIRVPAAAGKVLMSIPRGGLWFVRLRPCVGTVCQTWNTTYDPASSDPTRFPKGFVVFSKPAATSGGTVN